ncbi:MAG: SiaB family protein kinase [Bacteroidetes bacterium]|nr:SiaB family protein kinase [Bacteroidota bacterium]
MGKINIPHNDNACVSEALLSYQGPFDSRLRASLAEKIRELTSDFPYAGHKLFKVFMEVALNICFYSEDKIFVNSDGDSGTGILTVVEDDTHYILSASNKVNQDDLRTLMLRCQKINSLGREGLRLYKLEMSLMPRGLHGSANIGLIHIALISANRLEYSAEPVDNRCSVFTLNIKINKHEGY